MKRVTIYLGSKCNLNCTYCHREADKTEPVLSEPFLQKLKQEKDLHIKFMGGEPTLYMNIIKQVVESLPHAHFSIATNGVLLDKYLDYFREHKFFLCLSYDGTEEDLRGFDPFTKVINYPWLGVSCTVYHGNTNLTKIYDNFAAKEKVIGRKLNFYPHLMHVTNKLNAEYALTKRDCDDLIKQIQQFMNEFYSYLEIMGKPLVRFLALYDHLNRRLHGNYEYGETYCVNKDLCKVDVAGQMYSCQYIRDTKINSWQEQKDILDSFPTCKSCEVYHMCGGGCIKSQAHDVECYYYKKLYSWFKKWHEERRQLLKRLEHRDYDYKGSNSPFDVYVMRSNNYKACNAVITELHLDDTSLKLMYNIHGQNFIQNISLAKIPKGESAVINLNRDTEESTVIYHYKKFLQENGYAMPRVYETETNESTLVQINALSNNRYFVKLPPCVSNNLKITYNGELLPYGNVPLAELHQLDRFYTFTILPLECDIFQGNIVTKWCVNISPHYPKALYVNYNDKALEIDRDGIVQVIFPYVEGADFYWGDKGTKYGGRKYRMEMVNDG